MLSRQDLRQFGPKRADSGGNGNRYGRNDHQNRPIQPKQPSKQAKMGSGYHSSTSCGLVRGKKKKKEKEEEDDKTQKKKNGWKKNKGM